MADDTGPSSPVPAQTTDNGIQLAVRVTARSRKDAIGDVVTHGDVAVLNVHVHAVPHKGEANDAVARLLATWAGVSRSCVTLECIRPRWKHLGRKDATTNKGLERGSVSTKHGTALSSGARSRHKQFQIEGDPGDLPDRVENLQKG